MNTGIKYLLTPLLFCAMAGTAQASDNDDEQEFEVTLKSLNASGVYGKVEIEIKNNKKIKIKMQANGLEGGKLHPQHIHGMINVASNATCPDISADTNADGLISVGEGFPNYGPIVLPLVPFDLVGENGELRYEAQLTINPDSLQPLENRTIVLHGMTVNGVYIASLPIACGEIELDND